VMTSQLERPAPATSCPRLTQQEALANQFGPPARTKTTLIVHPKFLISVLLCSLGTCKIISNMPDENQNPEQSTPEPPQYYNPNSFSAIVSDDFTQVNPTPNTYISPAEPVLEPPTPKITSTRALKRRLIISVILMIAPVALLALLPRLFKSSNPWENLFLAMGTLMYICIPVFFIGAILLILTLKKLSEAHRTNHPEPSRLASLYPIIGSVMLAISIALFVGVCWQATNSFVSFGLLINELIFYLPFAVIGIVGILSGAKMIAQNPKATKFIKLSGIFLAVVASAAISFNTYKQNYTPNGDIQLTGDYSYDVKSADGNKYLEIHLGVSSTKARAVEVEIKGRVGNATNYDCWEQQDFTLQGHGKETLTIKIESEHLSSIIAASSATNNTLKIENIVIYNPAKNNARGTFIEASAKNVLSVKLDGLSYASNYSYWYYGEPDLIRGIAVSFPARIKTIAVTDQVTGTRYPATTDLAVSNRIEWVIKAPKEYATPNRLKIEMLDEKGNKIALPTAEIFVDLTQVE
jgi:hypothetical protein